MTRKLASIRRVASLTPIEGADRIEVAGIDGWNVIVQKGLYEVGHFCVYFEVDSFLPVEERYEFLRKNCFRSTTNLGDGFRIKTMKMRGVVSQGLLMPLSTYDDYEYTFADHVQEGDDITEYLKVQKYEKPIPLHLQGQIRGNFPSFLRKTDQERAQNLTKDILKRQDESFEVTMKLDGSSMTVYRDHNGNVGVCSRNIDLKEDDENVFWATAKKTGLIAYLNSIDRAIAFQGELMGPGVQGNREKLEEHAFFLFDVFDIVPFKYLGPEQRYHEYNEAIAHGCKFKHVPVIFTSNPLRTYLATQEVIPNLMELAEGESLAPGVKREGVVFKSWDSDFTFKLIANSYLLAED
ncbi:MAG: RNA ligase (ATP) [Betaproteobacteria bacterium]